MAWTEITRRPYRREGLRYGSDTTDAEWFVMEPLSGFSLHPRRRGDVRLSIAIRKNCPGQRTAGRCHAPRVAPLFCFCRCGSRVLRTDDRRPDWPLRRLDYIALHPPRRRRAARTADQVAGRIMHLMSKSKPEETDNVVRLSLREKRAGEATRDSEEAQHRALVHNPAPSLDGARVCAVQCQS